MKGIDIIGGIICRRLYERRVLRMVLMIVDVTGCLSWLVLLCALCSGDIIGELRAEQQL